MFTMRNKWFSTSIVHRKIANMYWTQKEALGTSGRIKPMKWNAVFGTAVKWCDFYKLKKKMSESRRNVHRILKINLLKLLPRVSPGH